MDTDSIYKDWHNILEDNSKLYGAKTCIVSLDHNKLVTFNQIRNLCNKVANFLQDCGISKNDKITLVGKNTIETLIVYFGVLNYGAIINPIFFEESQDNIYRIINIAKPKIVIYDSDLNLEMARFPQAQWLTYSENDLKKPRKDGLFSKLEQHGFEFSSHMGESKDMALNVFTSGTTDVPKGVLISRKALFLMAKEIIERINLSKDDKFLEYRAYNWLSAQTLAILPCMITGTTLCFGKKFSRSRFTNWLIENDITISSGVPAVFNMLLNNPVPLSKKDVPSLKFITSSSAPLRTEDHLKFEKIYGIRINQMMGMSEAGWMAGNPPSKRKVGSVGIPLKYKSIFFVNEMGELCKPGVIGEMYVKGDSLGLGYLREDGSIDEFSDKGLSTGDLGYMDDDGYIFITGRKKDLIIRGGINISPMEITSRLLEHPMIIDAATIGVPDKIYGEDIASFIVLKNGFEVTDDSIIQHCKGVLPEFKIPKKLIRVNEISKNQRGKVSKKYLTELYMRLGQC